MLQEDTIDRRTLELIRQLHNDKKLQDFCLAGGTALALYLGHRKSVDIDLFSLKDFGTAALLEHLEQTYNFSVQFSTENTLKGFINGIFVDLITHNYPLVAKNENEKGICLYSIQDIAAMKVNAIAGDGTRIKDFIDIYFLLKKYSLTGIISFFTKKYGLRNEFHAVKSLGYFDDLDAEPDWPVMLKEKNLTLKKIKSTLEKEIKNYLEKK